MNVSVKTMLRRADRLFARACHAAMIALAMTLALMMAAAVFLRYVLDQSFPAIEEASILIGLWLYFVAIIVVTRERSHLTGGIVDLFDLNDRTRILIRSFNDLLGLAVVCFFAYFAFKYLFFVMKINRTSTNLGWPTALWVGAAIAGFVFMTVYKLRDLFNHDNTYSTYDNKSPHPASAELKESC